MKKQGTVLITGGSRGLGAVIAKQFGEKGYQVIVNYFKSEQKAFQVADGIGKDHAVAIKADVRDKQ